jgi:hypothetical protein
MSPSAWIASIERKSGNDFQASRSPALFECPVRCPVREFCRVEIDIALVGKEQGCIDTLFASFL